MWLFGIGRRDCVALSSGLFLVLDECRECAAFLFEQTKAYGALIVVQ